MKKTYLLILVFTFSMLAARSQTISFVMFDNVKAYEKNGGVQIEWSNLTERDLSDYIVEHSSDGYSFDTLRYQKPLNNRNDRADYTIYDETPGSGTNYYRIRVSGTAGRSAVSSVLKVEIERKKQEGFNIYPNPVTGTQLSINISGQRPGNIIVQVYNMMGNQVLQKTIVYPGRFMTQSVRLPAELQAGVYTIVAGDGNWLQKRIFIRK